MVLLKKNEDTDEKVLKFFSENLEINVTKTILCNIYFKIFTKKL